MNTDDQARLARLEEKMEQMARDLAAQKSKFAAHEAEHARAIRDARSMARFPSRLAKP